MKYLSDYVNDRTGELYERTGAFFAFGNDQFNEKRQEGVIYVRMGMGLLCPKANAKELSDGLDKAYNEGVAQDLKENGIQAIIKRELYNYECFYSGDYQEVIDRLVNDQYGITEEEIHAAYQAERANTYELM
jgi:hypothetical protein